MRRTLPFRRLSHRNFSSPAKLPTAPALLRERIEAATSSPIPLPTSLTPKRHRPSRVTDLYNALVYEVDAKPLSDSWRSVMAISQSTEPAPDTLSNSLRERLESCRQCSHAEAAIQVLQEIEQQGFVPSARAVVIAVEACLPAEEFDLAEQALARLDALPPSHPASNPRLVVSARALVAMAYASRSRFEDALRVMHLPEKGSAIWRDKVGVAAVLDNAGLGKDTVAWGVVVKALTKLQMSNAAVEVVDYAMGKGVGMTDSLLHLTIDALRIGKRWREADWLFKTAMKKGVNASERTVASMLLALSDRDAKRTVSVSRVEELVGMVENPSQRFLSSALLVLGSFGALKRAEETFARITDGAKGNVADEYAFAWMMGAYGNYVDSGWEAAGAENDNEGRYEEVNRKADATWETYLETYGRRRPMAKMKKLRLGILSKYLGAKTRCFKIDEAIDVLRNVVRDGERYRWFELNQVHFASVLGAVELCCDVVQLKQILEVMEENGTRHDIRSLAFSVGTYIGNGDVGTGLALVRAEAPRLVADDYFDSYLRHYHFAMLQRRLEMLSSALREGSGKVKDLDDIIAVLKQRRTAVNV